MNRVKVKLPLEPDFSYLRFHDVLEKNDWVRRVENKVVILGYTGPKLPDIETEMGTVSPHELYVSLLKSLFDGGIY